MSLMSSRSVKRMLARQLERDNVLGTHVGQGHGHDLEHGLTVETTLDPKIQPFLYDHQIDDTPVLPGVMGIEAFAEAALWMLPGWHVEAIEAVDFLAPFKFYRNEPRTLTVQAVFCPQDDGLRAECRLIGSRSLPNQPDPQVTTHFTARVRLAKQPRRAATDGVPMGAPPSSAMEAADIYRVYFHGPAYQVVERAWRDGNRITGEMAKGLPIHHHPPARPLLAGPRLIELCFQTAGLWEMSTQGRMGLPQHLDQVCLWPTPAAAEGELYAVVTPDPDHGTFDAVVVDSTGKQYVSLTGYRTVALPSSVDAQPLKALGAAA